MLKYLPNKAKRIKSKGNASHRRQNISDPNGLGIGFPIRFPTRFVARFVGGWGFRTLRGAGGFVGCPLEASVDSESELAESHPEHHILVERQTSGGDRNPDAVRVAGLPYGIGDRLYLLNVGYGYRDGSVGVDGENLHGIHISTGQQLTKVDYEGGVQSPVGRYEVRRSHYLVIGGSVYRSISSGCS